MHFTGQVRDQAGNLSVLVKRDLMLDNVAPVITRTSAGDTTKLQAVAGTPRGEEVTERFGGPGRDRTDDLFHAMEARSQLRHRPTVFILA